MKGYNARGDLEPKGMMMVDLYFELQGYFLIAGYALVEVKSKFRYAGEGMAGEKAVIKVGQNHKGVCRCCIFCLTYL